MNRRFARCVGVAVWFCAAVTFPGPARAQPADPELPKYRAVDLNPTGYITSIGYAVSGGQQVGWAEQPFRHAALWSGAAGSFVDLHPAGSEYIRSEARTVAGNRQGGIVDLHSVFGGLGYQAEHAMLWSGTAASAVDLHPGTAAGYSHSDLYDMNATRQVGSVTVGLFNSSIHAAAWSGTAGSFVDLHPAQFAASYAMGISRTGDQIVGQAFYAPGAGDPGAHALLWSSDGTVTNLRPSGFSYTEAHAADGGRQAGWGRGETRTGNQYHALMWEGSAQDFTDLNPPGADESYTSDILGDTIVGYAQGPVTGGVPHAYAWRITVDTSGEEPIRHISPIDLHLGLSPEYTMSNALGVDDIGAIVGQAFYAPTQQWHAIVWVPEPAATLPLALLALAAGRWRRWRRPADDCHATE